MDVYTSYISTPEDEEVKLIKDITKPDKVSVRNAYVVTSGKTPILTLRKGSHEKEKIPFTAVSQYRRSQGLDIIELRGDNNKSAFIRIKSRNSLDRWVEYLNTFISPSENEYEVPDAHRGRSFTNTIHNRQNPRRTPRTSGSVQSVVDMVPTTFSQPVNARQVMDALPEGDDYDVVTYENYPRSVGHKSDKDYDSLRSTDDDVYDEVPEVLHQEDDIESQTVVNVNVIHNTSKKESRPNLPKRGSSVKSQLGARFCQPLDNLHMGELKVALQQRNTSSRPKPNPPPRTNIRQTDAELKEVRTGQEAGLDDVAGADGEIYLVRQTLGRSDGTALRTFKPEVPRRNQTGEFREDARGEATIIEDSSSSQSSSSSSSDDEEDQTPQNGPVRTDIYADNARLAMKCEMEEVHGIICHAELGQLKHLGIVTTRYGACINDVPANLHRKFYHGDRIISINEQRIADAGFARSIIRTSQSKMVKVTVRRLFKGHFIELERGNTEGSEALGFALHNGSEIKYISPGTMFAKQATNEMMTEKPCITHIENNFIPPGTPTKEVNVALRNADKKFFIIIQPVEFMKELMQQS